MDKYMDKYILKYHQSRVGFGLNLGLIRTGFAEVLEIRFRKDQIE